MMDSSRAKKMGFAADGGSSGGGFDRPQICAIKSDPTYIRIVENLDNAVMCGISWIKCKINNQELLLPFTVSRTYDDGTQLKTERSILGELIAYVSEKEPLVDKDGKKIMNERGKQAWGPKRQAQFPDVFNFMFPPAKDAKKWNPQSLMYLNVIDRMDNWCQQNNHTKILGKSDKAEGIGSKLWESIISIFEENGNVNDYDLSVKKSGVSMDTKYYINLVMENAVTKGYIKQGPITEQEQQYEHYNIAALTKLTSSKTIIERLGDDIRWIDSQLGSNYYNRLLQDAGSEDSDQQDNEQAPAQTPARASAPVAQQPQAASPVNRFNALKDNVAAQAPAPAKAGFTVKKKVEDVVQDDKIPCPECGTYLSPDTTVCPKCGTEFA